MSHPFGDLLGQYLHRKHGLSQSKLAAGIIQDPAIITRMCKGERMTGPHARERILLIIRWLCEQGAINTVDEADALLDAAGMSPLRVSKPGDHVALSVLKHPVLVKTAPAPSPQSPINRRATLPASPTSFIGRAGELDTLRQHLDDPQCRLLTLAGPGGIGKTRLAIELAHSYSHRSFPDGIYFVDLQPVSEINAMPFSIADALGFSLSGSESPWQQLQRQLGNKQLLLIMDNFEHLMEGGATQVSDVLQAAPDIKIMITSRQVLNVRGEWQYWVQGVDYPREMHGELMHYDAVRLFVDCARRVQPSFDFEPNAGAIAHICQMTEGLPLAIEMAAARTKSLSCAGIAHELESGLAFLSSHLRNVTPRHKSMQAAFEHSWRMLTQHEQTVFARMSVFRGGFTRAAAECVAGASLDDLSALVDQSFIQYSPNERYRVHELMRQYGEERLDQSEGERELTHEKHACYYAAFIDKQARPLLIKRQHELLPLCRPDMDNLRMAWRWAVHHGDLNAICTCAMPIYWIAQYQSSYLEGVTLMQSAVESLRAFSEGQKRDTGLIEVLPYLSWLQLRLGRIEDAEASSKECLALQASLNTLPKAAWASGVLTILSIVAAIRGDYAQAERLALEERAQIENTGRWLDFPVARYAFANAAIAQGRHDDAQEAILEAIAICEKYGERWFMAYCLTTLGNIEYTKRRLQQAAEHFEAAYQLRRKFDDAEGMAQALYRLGGIALDEGKIFSASQHYEESLSLYHDLNDRGGLAAVYKGLGDVACAKKQYEQAANFYQHALQITCDIQYVSLIFSLLVAIACLFVSVDEPAAACKLFWLVIHHPASDHACRERARASIKQFRDALPPPATDTDWQAVLKRECEATSRRLQVFNQPK